MRECAYEAPTDVDDVRVLRFELLSSDQLSMSNPTDMNLPLPLRLLRSLLLLLLLGFLSSSLVLLITET
mgnify:FL=1